MFFVLLVAVFFHVGAIYFSFDSGFSQQISNEVVFYSTLDLVLSFFVTYIVLVKLKKTKKNIDIHYQNTYLVVFEKYKWLMLLVVLYAAFLAYQSVLLISSGALRHQLLGEFGAAGFDYMFISGFFKLLLPMMFYFRSSLSLKLVATVGLFLSILITASRSELRYVIHFFLVLLIFNNGSDGNKKLAKFLMISFCMILLAILVTTFVQNRPISDGPQAFVDITKSVFQYRAYGYYMAEFSIVDAQYFDKVLFPFGGYVAEFLVRVMGASEVPINSDYVGLLRYLGESSETGRPYLSNVVYPWWSWFVGTYGVLGLFLKAAYVLVLLFLCLSNRLIFTLVLLLSFVLLGTAVSHPLMTLTHVFAFGVALFVDLSVKLVSKKRKIL